MLYIHDNITFVVFCVIECMSRFWLFMNPICSRSVVKTAEPSRRHSVIVNDVELRCRSAVDERHKKLLWNFYSSVAGEKFHVENRVARVVGPRSENIRYRWIVRLRLLSSHPLEHFIKLFICCSFIAPANSWRVSKCFQSQRIFQTNRKTANIKSFTSRRCTSWELFGKFRASLCVPSFE